MLHLTLFDGFRLVTDNGTEIVLRMYKDRALLAYLALHSGKHFTRSQIAGLLWGNQSEVNARHSLSQSLSTLKAALGSQSGILERGRKDIGFKKDSLRIDLDEFSEFSGSKEVELRLRAFEMYRDTLLSEFDFDEPGFNDWVYVQRQRYHSSMVEAGLNFLSNQSEGH